MTRKAQNDENGAVAMALLVLAAVLVSWLLEGCYASHTAPELVDPDYHGCPQVDRTFERDCPDIGDLRGCPYLDRPCEWFHAAYIQDALRSMSCEERAALRADYCPAGATELWPPAPSWSPCCEAELVDLEEE